MWEIFKVPVFVGQVLFILKSHIVGHIVQRAIGQVRVFVFLWHKGKQHWIGDVDTYSSQQSFSYIQFFFFLHSWWILPCLNKELFYSILFQYIEDIAWSRGDTKFLFECWKIFHSLAALTRERFFQHEKRNFVSPSDHVLFYLLYKHQWNAKPFYLNIFFGLKGAVYYEAIAMYFHMWRFQVFARKLSWYIFYWCL